MKFVIAALLGAAQASVPIGQLVALNNEIEFDDSMVQLNRPEDGYYNAWEAQKTKDDLGDPLPIDPLKYNRVIPAHFTTGTDDIFQRSMLKTYAVEEKECEHDEDDKPIKDKCKPTGLFFLNEAGAKAAAKEVLATHKGLTGDALKSYLDTYFAKAWAHFDVNKSGIIEVSKAPQFMRFLASDQRLSLGESGF